LIGILGEIHPETAQNFDIKEKVYVAELNLEKLLEFKKREIKYKEIPKYPSISRDAALIVKDNVSVGEILKEVEAKDYEYLESVDFFDIYKGKGIEEGYKSLAFSFVFRSRQRTLNDDEISSIFKNIICNLGEKFDARLR
jgi:phenylalanyl-tRNA synthetase beta chain